MEENKEEEGVLSQRSRTVSRVRGPPGCRGILFIIPKGVEAVEDNEYEDLHGEPNGGLDRMFWNMLGREVPVWCVRESEVAELFSTDERDDTPLSSPCPKPRHPAHGLGLSLDLSGSAYPASPKASRCGLGALADSSTVCAMLDEASNCEAGRTDEDGDNMPHDSITSSSPRHDGDSAPSTPNTRLISSLSTE